MATYSLDDIVKKQAIQFADQIKQAVQFAEKEEEIRIEAERALAVIQREVGITLKGRHEFTIGTGRVDSVYGCVIIEYKNPNDPSSRLSSNRDSKGNQEVIKQVKTRFYEFKKEENKPLNTMFGVGCDGNFFIFIRYRDEKWYIEDPVEVSKSSAERFLWALINMGTKGKAFTPEYLAGDFGSESLLTKDGINAFYNTICNTSNPKAQVFFNQWKILFGEVCGYDVNTLSSKIQKLSELYEISGKVKPAELLFAMQVYYALFMKLLSAEIVAFFHKLPTPIQRILKAPTSDKLKEEMEDLEKGSIFRHFNITNFLEGDFFSWYPETWNESIEKLVRDMANRLDSYNPGTLSEDPAGSRDLLKKLYQELFPKSVRHDLGEYYTPDWLAEHVLNELKYEGNPDLTILDPACGSGTFLIMAINRVRKWYDRNREICEYDESDLIKKILDNIVGFDLNPLAVMAARTNYLIAIRDLISRIDKIEIPVYLCDSILTPSEYGGLETWTTGKNVKIRTIKTSAANFRIPSEIASDRQKLALYTEQLEFCTRNEYQPIEFINRCKNEGLQITADENHKDLYNQILKLDKANKNGVWARIIKNAFAPLFINKVDIVVGNPPWINWENLPDDYKIQVKRLMQEYGLMMAKGWEARLGSAKYDLSMLFVYVCIDRYLTKNGLLGFVITQSVFQSDAGKGFRKFYIKTADSEFAFQPLIVNDMTAFQPFDGVSNRTSTVIFKKNSKVEYPLPYNIWINKVSINSDMELSEIILNMQIIEHETKPVDPNDVTSRWLISRDQEDVWINKVLGKSDYVAKMGSNTEGSNGVFWVNILKNIDENKVLIRNIIKRIKKPVKQVTHTIEKKYLVPLLRSGDVKRWFTYNEAYLIFLSKHKKNDIKELILKNKYPKLYEYLYQFRDNLESRKSYIGKMKKQGYPFYTMYGAESMSAPYKVIWNRMGSKINAVVVAQINDEFLGLVSPVPQETLIYVPLKNEDEAHYLCAMLNSPIVNAVVDRYSLTGSKSFASVHILKNIRVQSFSNSNKFHVKLAKLSKKCHEAAMEGNHILLEELEMEIFQTSAKIWNISENELKAIKEGF